MAKSNKFTKSLTNLLFIIVILLIVIAVFNYFTKSQFLVEGFWEKTETISNGNYYLTLFYADWCGPCKVLTPLMENVKTKFNNVNFEDIDIEVQYEVAQKYHVRSVPTVIIEKNGEEVQRFTGVQSEMAYINALNENL